jgi:hypothetical protein
MVLDVMVRVTRAPRAVAPVNSVRAARMPACGMVSVREATLVA